MRFYILLFTFSLWTSALAQSGTIYGAVNNSINNSPIEFSKVQLIGFQKGAFSDSLGNYVIEGVEPGLYSIKISSSGFNEIVISDIVVSNARSAEVNVNLEEIVVEQDEVTVRANPFRKIKESPISLKIMSAAEIQRLPGANRDASKVLQALPGVASPASFRNDIIIRGGSPSENKFYLDGIEIPNINHFATQGSSGGPVGLLNINFIREIDFYSGAMPSNYGSGLSSVISFKQKEGNKDNLIANIALGSSDLALTLDGPIGEKTSFIFSVRRSYLQLLFSVLKLPFLPTYNDAQFKVDHVINRNNKISFIGLGAFDQFALNTAVNEGIESANELELNNYLLDNIPTQNQWNYTVGVNYLHYSENSNQRFILSRNMLNNQSRKYKDNIENPANLAFDYSSFEIENKFRFENTWRKNGYRVLAGVSYEYSRYQSSIYNEVIVNGIFQIIDGVSNLDVHKGALFGQVSKSYFKDKIDVSVGLRTDIANYSSEMMNPLQQLYPSISISCNITNQLSLSANVARYNQLPSYTILGYRDKNGTLKNKENQLKYIRADHFVFGGSFVSKFDAKFSLEGFWKNYEFYPFSVNDSISLANLGNDFGVIGNEEVSSSSNGRAYGLEFLYQQKLIKGFYCLFAYTYVTSEFETKNGGYSPSTWDSKHIISLTGGKRFKKGWEIGLRWSFSGGAPYTTADLEISSNKAVWDVTNSAVLDYNQLNQNRGSNYHQLNLRIDKRFNFKKVSLTFYLDIQNVYNFKATTAPIILVERDENGAPIEDLNNPNKYVLKSIENTSGIIQPSIGIILEFKVRKSKER